MNYEIVYLDGKTVAGTKIRTSSSNPNMSQAIGELWQGFFERGIYQSIPHKKNDKTIGLYTNYEKDTYDVMVCCEILETCDVDEELYIQTIDSGKYAKFIVKGHVQKEVSEFWMQLCSIKLDRKYSFDFEEYQEDCDMDNGEIHIYISLNE